MGIDKLASGGGLMEGFKSLSDGFQIGDIAGLAKMASGFLPPPQNMIAGAAAGMLAGEDPMKAAMSGLTPGGIGDALGGLGIDEGIVSGITDAAGNLQSDPSAANMNKFYEELAKIPENKREQAMDAIKGLLPQGVQDAIAGGAGGGIGGITNSIGIS